MPELWLRPIADEVALDLFEQALASVPRQCYYPGAIIALVRLVEVEIQAQVSERERRRDRHARAGRRALPE